MSVDDPLPDTLIGLAGQSDAAEAADAALRNEDLQLSLWVCYELSYRGFDDVDDAWECEPSMLAVRGALETRFLAALRHLAATAVSIEAVADAETVPAALSALIDADDGPALALYLQRTATAEQFGEFVAHRSIYQLKEGVAARWRKRPPPPGHHQAR